MRYITMICDLMNSRNIENREELQYKLIGMLKETNRIFARELVSPFIITVGDEWEGLLKYHADYIGILNYFHSTLKDVNFYCGLGIGEVTIHDFELTVNQLDGPAFYMARDAIKMAKENQYRLVLIEG